MEKMPQTEQNGVEISREVFNGLESIRQSGMTNMLDRPTVLQLAREWEFDATADWIESVDRKTYAEMIFKGPIVVDDETVEGIEDKGVAPDDF